MSSIPSIASSSENKENQPAGSLPGLTPGTTTPARMPLKQVNRTPGSSTPLFLKRAQYSQVTPFNTPPAKPRYAKQGTPLLLHLPGKSPSTRDVHLNSLVYKKVMEVIAQNEKEHEAVLEQKQETITMLEQQVQALSLTKSEAGTCTRTETRQDAATCMSAPGTPVIHRERVDQGSSPYPTPTMILPLPLLHPLTNLLSPATATQREPLDKFTLDESFDRDPDSNSQTHQECTTKAADGKNSDSIAESVSSVSRLACLQSDKESTQESQTLTATVETMVTPVKQVSTSQMTSPAASPDNNALSVRELLDQQDELLSDLTSLRDALQQRDEMIASLKTSYEQRMAELNWELVAVKHGIASGYQRNKQEIDALRRGQEQADYEPHYLRSREEVKRLKTQLQVYVGLMDEMEQSQSLMGEAAEAVQHTFDDLQKALQKYNSERQQWQQQVADWESEKCGVLQENKKLAEKIEQVVQKRIEAEKLAKTCQIEKAAIDKLKKDVSDLKKALTAQSVLASNLTQERDRYRSVAECQRLCNSSLQEEAHKARLLEKQVQELKQEIAFLQAEHSTQENELANKTADLKAQGDDLDSLHEELNETKVQAHLKLLQQGEELTAAHVVVSEFSKRCWELEGLLAKYGHQSGSPTPKKVTKREKKQKTGGRKSFVYSVLLAASGRLDESLGENSCDVAIPEEERNVVDGADDDLQLPVQMRLEKLNSVFDHIMDTFNKLDHSLNATVSELQNKLSVSASDLLKERAEVEENRLELTRLQEADVHQKASITRCRSQIQKLNHNWKAAEAELQDVAEINEEVRKVLCEHEPQIVRWQEVTTLRNLGMLSDVDATEDLLA